MKLTFMKLMGLGLLILLCLTGEAGAQTCNAPCCPDRPCGVLPPPPGGRLVDCSNTGYRSQHTQWCACQDALRQVPPSVPNSKLGGAKLCNPQKPSWYYCAPDQFCDRKPEMEQACRGIGNPQKGVCTPYGSIPQDRQCDTSPECQAGLICRGSRCIAPGTQPEGAACLLSLDCTQGMACVFGICTAPHTQPVGAVCRISNDCVQGSVCRAGRCTTGAAGEACLLNPDCDQGLTCLLPSRTCVAPHSRGNGDTCSQDDQCVDDLRCRAGRCSAGEAGDSCQSPTGCNDGLVCVPIVNECEQPPNTNNLPQLGSPF